MNNLIYTKSVQSHARCADAIFESYKDAVETEKTRLAYAYAALPTDPIEALKAARKALGDDLSDVQHSFKEAYHLSVLLLSALSMEECQTDTTREDMEFCMRMVTDRLRNDVRNLQVVADIISKPLQSA